MEESKELLYDIAVELARKYYALQLTIAQKDGQDITELLKDESLYKNKIEELLHNKVSDEEITFLWALPDWIRWDKEKALELYKEYSAVKQ